MWLNAKSIHDLHAYTTQKGIFECFSSCEKLTRHIGKPVPQSHLTELAAGLAAVLRPAVNPNRLSLSVQTNG